MWSLRSLGDNSVSSQGSLLSPTCLHRYVRSVLCRVEPLGFSSSAWTRGAPISGSPGSLPAPSTPPPVEAAYPSGVADVQGQSLGLSQLKETWCFLAQCSSRDQPHPWNQGPCGLHRLKFRRKLVGESEKPKKAGTAPGLASTPSSRQLADRAPRVRGEGGSWG